MSVLEAVTLNERRDRAVLAMENAALCRQVAELVAVVNVQMTALRYYAGEEGHPVSGEKGRDSGEFAKAVLAEVSTVDVEPVSKSSDEWFALYERCSRVIRAANELVMFLGTSKEMLADWS